MDNLYELVKSMRTLNINKDKCIEEKNILKKLIFCKYYLSSQQYGPLLEKYIKNNLNILKKKDELSGDGYKDGKNIEIKVTTVTNDGKLNIVQLRPNHKIDYYLILVYDLNYSDLGNVFFLFIPKIDINNLIVKYGAYAHGTYKKNGLISHNNFKNYEFSLRPNMLKKDNLWNEIYPKYLIKELIYIILLILVAR